MDLANNYDFTRNMDQEGFIHLTGEACGLGISILYDLTPEAINTLFRGTSLVPTKKNVNHRQEQVASCLLPYSFLFPLMVNLAFKKAKNAVYLTGKEEHKENWRLEDRLLTEEDLEEIRDLGYLEAPHFYNIILEKHRGSVVVGQPYDLDLVDRINVPGFFVNRVSCELPFPEVELTVYNDHGKTVLYQLFGGLVAPKGTFTIPLHFVKYLRYYGACLLYDFVVLARDENIFTTNSPSRFTEKLSQLREEENVERFHNYKPYQYLDYEGVERQAEGYPLRHTHAFGGFNHGSGSNKVFTFKDSETGMGYFSQINNPTLY